MIEIKDLLLRFNNLLISGELQKNTVRTIISETIGVEIKSENISIKNGTVYLDIKPIYKNEIFLKQEKIIEKLSQTLGKKSPIDLR